MTTRIPPSDSVSRPVTSALILPRSRKIGRRRLKPDDHHDAEEGKEDQRQGGQAPVQPEENNAATTAVKRPPTICTKPGADEVPHALGVAS